MPQDRKVTDEELSAFADGQLPQQTSARVAAHLRANSADADRIHAYWKQEAELYSVFASGPAQAPLAPPAEQAASWPLYTAVAAVLILALAAPWLLLSGSGQAPTISLQPPAQHAGTSYASLDLQPGGSAMAEISIEGQFTSYHFSDPGGTLLVLHESTAPNGAYPPSETAGTARVEWVARGHRYILEGALGAAELLSLAVSLRGQMAPPALSTGTARVASPAASPAMRTLAEPLQPSSGTLLPAGVSKM